MSNKIIEKKKIKWLKWTNERISNEEKPKIKLFKSRKKYVQKVYRRK